MIKYKYTQKTADYFAFDFLMDKEYTVREFIEEIVHTDNNCWGRFYITLGRYIEYKKGKILTEIPEDLGNLIVLKATGNDSWTNMNIWITTLTQ